jgi:uncharacterized membrane protein YhaH (DUF805 family)
MELINKLEKIVAGWLRPLPNLPKSGQKWLAENVWWLALISAILTGISILLSLGAIATYASYSASLASVGAYSYIAAASYGSGWIISAIVTLIFSVIIVLLTALAVNPLKAMKNRGWQLLFVIYLVSAVEVVVNAVLSYSVIGFIFGIIFGAIGLAIGGYFLLQIKSYFGSTAKAKHIAK